MKSLWSIISVSASDLQLVLSSPPSLALNAVFERVEPISCTSNFWLIKESKRKRRKEIKDSERLWTLSHRWTWVLALKQRLAAWPFRGLSDKGFLGPYTTVAWIPVPLGRAVVVPQERELLTNRDYTEVPPCLCTAVHNDRIAPIWYNSICTYELFGDWGASY